MRSFAESNPEASPARAQRARIVSFAALLGALLGATLWRTPCAAGDGDAALRSLMSEMRVSPGVSAHFVERKEVALLSAPLVSSGMLYFAPPDTLLRMTTAPSEARLLLSGDRVEFRDGAGADRFDIGANAAARQFVENFLVLFTGDLEALSARYAIGFTTDDNRWRVDLKPKRAPFDKLVEAVVLEGSGAILRSIEIRERDGDKTVTRLSGMNATDPVTDAELFERFADGRSAPNG